MSESATLKKQFELIQLQQQQKLQRLKQRKDEKEKSRINGNTKSQTPDVLSSTAFGIDDNLDLKVCARAHYIYFLNDDFQVSYNL